MTDKDKKLAAETAGDSADATEKITEKTYQAQWRLSHNGHTHDAGDTVVFLTHDEIATNEVIALLKSGVITPYIKDK